MNPELIRQHPSVRALVEVLPVDSFGFGPALAELIRLQNYGVELTPDVVRKVGEKFAKTFPGQPSDPRFQPSDGEVVYYARIGNRIKIGTTSNLISRMATINPEELMATEPGSYTLEHERHLQFAHLRTHGEWFRHEGLLTEHIERIRSK